MDDERTDAGRDDRTCHSRPNSYQARMRWGKYLKIRSDEHLGLSSFDLLSQERNVYSIYYRSRVLSGDDLPGRREPDEHSPAS